jgi:hypothetical protein
VRRLNPLRRPAPPPPRRRSLSSRFVRAALLVFAVVVAWWAVDEVLPRWWAYQVGSTVDHSLSRGVVTGLLCGAAFTVLPLLAVGQVTRPGLRWSRRLLIALGVLALAMPNLLTLSIQLGSDAASVYGRQVFDVDAPGFRGASLFGALAALVSLVVFGSARRDGTGAGQAPPRAPSGGGGQGRQPGR